MELTYSVFENHLHVLRKVRSDFKKESNRFLKNGSLRLAKIYNEKALRTEERIKEIEKRLKKD